jgi:hypothetical protein
LGCLIALAAASPAYAANGLVASWPFDEGSGTAVQDTSGHGNNGVLSGDAQWIGGFSGSALSFDGNTGRVRVPDSASLDPTAAVSVSAWVRATEPQSDFNYILAKGASGCLAASYGLYTGPNGGLMFYVARNKGLSYTRSPDAGHGVWNGSWHLVVGTYDGNSVRLYLDGSQVGNGTAHTGPIDYDFPDNDLFIGHYNTCPTEDFHGDVDSAQIYNRALTPSEVRSTYDNLTGASSAGGTSPGGTSPSQPGSATSPASRGSTPLSSSGSGTRQSGLTGASVSGLSNGKPHLVVRVTARKGTNPIKSFTVMLPQGLHFAQSLAKVRSGVSLAHRPKCSLSLSHNQLVIVFKRPQRSVALTIGGPALTETSSLVKRVQAIVKFNRTKPRAKKRVLALRLGMRLTDVKAKSASVHTVLRVS